MGNSYLEKIRLLNEKLETDPEFLEQTAKQLLEQIIITENQEVFGLSEPPLTYEDIAAIAFDPHYFEDKLVNNSEIWYNFHGQGD